MIDFDYSKLKGKIVEKYGNQTKFAKDIKMGNGSLNNKINGKTPFTDQEIIKIAKRLVDDPSELPTAIYQYFFSLKS